MIFQNANWKAGFRDLIRVDRIVPILNYNKERSWVLRQGIKSEANMKNEQ